MSTTTLTLTPEQVDSLRWALSIAIDLDEVEHDDTRDDLQSILEQIGA